MPVERCSLLRQRWWTSRMLGASQFWKECNLCHSPMMLIPHSCWLIMTVHLSDDVSAKLMHLSAP